MFPCVSCYFLTHFGLGFSSMVMWQAINIIGWSHNIMKFKDVMTVHQMISSPKLLLHTWDPFLISTLFEKFWRHCELCYLISFSSPFFYIVQTQYWFLKSFRMNFSDLWNPISIFINWFVTILFCVFPSVFTRTCQKNLKYLQGVFH